MAETTEVPQADVHANGNNPMCGDDVTVHLHLGADDKVDAISFTGAGCSICMASASMMTLKVKHKTRQEAKELSQAFTQMLTVEEESAPDKRLGNLGLLIGVRKFPLRVKCATLAWHALEDALAGNASPAP